MPLRDRVQAAWERQVAKATACFTVAPIFQKEGETPPEQPISMSMAPETAATYQRTAHSQRRVAPSDMSTRAAGADCIEDEVIKEGDEWVVRGVGRFRHKAVYTFENGQLPDGLYASNYTVHGADESGNVPFNHIYEPDNVRILDGFLHLVVPGGQRPGRRPDKAIRSAEVVTIASNILHGSVRTSAIFSDVPGTCHGLFFYKDDTQETDIEYLTDPRSLSNNGPDQPIPVWYTNQAVDPINEPLTSESGPAPDDCTASVHEYRLDWTSEFTAFYIDGVLQKKHFNNVPSVPGPWIWNNWANGNKGWAVGPPRKDNILKIQSITMYYNTADAVGEPEQELEHEG